MHGSKSGSNGQVLAPKAHVDVNNVLAIVIAQKHHYKERDWKKAIKVFLNGIWGKHGDIINCPEIKFGEITLRLDDTMMDYTVSGQPNDQYTLIGRMMMRSSGHEYSVLADKVSVEQALSKLVYDDTISKISINFGDKTLIFEKTVKLEQYIVRFLSILDTFRS